MEIKNGKIVNSQAQIEVDGNKPTQSNSTALVGANGSTIFTLMQDVPQYGRVAESLDKAGLPQEILINTANERGDRVVLTSVLLPVGQSFRIKTGVEIGPDYVISVRKSDRVLITSQLPNSQHEQSIIPTNQITENQTAQEVKVLEGVGIFPEQPTKLAQTAPTQNQNPNLINNPFLNAPAILKKAA